MPQLHLYLPENIASEVRRRAEAQGQSVSKYLAALVRRDVGLGWPEGFFDEVVGGWKGEPIKRPPQGHLEDRDRL
jgi:hypothetical protein